MPPVINESMCLQCMTCVQICSMDVFGPVDADSPRVIYPEECWHCRACAIDCPTGAITIRYPLPMTMLCKEAPKYTSQE